MGIVPVQRYQFFCDGSECEGNYDACYEDFDSPESAKAEAVRSGLQEVGRLWLCHECREREAAGQPPWEGR